MSEHEKLALEMSKQSGAQIPHDDWHSALQPGTQRGAECKPDC